MLEYSDLDRDFLDQVTRRAGGERAANCFSCGTCTAGCPVSALCPEHNPRRIMRMVQLGLRDQALRAPELWQCSQCHVCVAHCPQDARCADVIRVLRQMAVEQGCAPQALADGVERLDEEMRRERIRRVWELLGREP